MKNIYRPDHIAEALNAASTIGGDLLQKQVTGQVMSNIFTHSTSARHMYWLKKGFETGDMAQGDTFGNAGLQ